jgi:hypothetical protein
VQGVLSTDAGGVGLNYSPPPRSSASNPVESRASSSGLGAFTGSVGPVGHRHHADERASKSAFGRRWAQEVSVRRGLRFAHRRGQLRQAGLGTVLQAVKEIFAEQPARPKPIIDLQPPRPAGERDLGGGFRTDRGGRQFLRSLSSQGESMNLCPALPARRTQSDDALHPAPSRWARAGVKRSRAFSASSRSRDSELHLTGRAPSCRAPVATASIAALASASGSGG